MPAASVLIDRLDVAAEAIDRQAANAPDHANARRLRAAAYGAKSAADYLRTTYGTDGERDVDLGEGARFTMIAEIAEAGGRIPPGNDLNKETTYAWMADVEHVLDRASEDGKTYFYLARHDYR